MAKTTTAPQQKINKKFWNMANIDGENAELTLYGDIYSETPRDWWTGEAIEGQYITPEGFLEDLEVIKNAKNITVKLNSCGGDLYTGIAIHNALKALKANINVIVEGIAASAASIIMCAGDTVTVHVGSLIMIHGVGAFFCDYLMLDDLDKQMRAFEAAENAIAAIYSQKTGKDIEELRSMMKQETWMTGKQAADLGFADEILESETAEINMVNKNVLMVNGVKLDFTGHNIPLNLIKQKVINQETGGKKPMAKSKFQEFIAGMSKLTNKFVNSTDVDEEQELQNSEEENEDEQQNTDSNTKTNSDSEEQLKNDEGNEDEEQQPQNSVKKQIQAAILAERKRCQEIDELPSNVSEKLKNEAKYGKKPCNAGELAMLVLRQNDPSNNAALDKLNTDATNSQAKNVVTSSATPDDLKEDEKKVAEAKEFAAQRKARREKK